MTSTFTMPLGPVHVALEEPVYFHLTVDGETVRHVELTSGHVHRGMEAMATQRNLVKNVTLTERVCSLCSNSHSFTYSMVVENVLGITIPDRARYLRVVADEKTHVVLGAQLMCERASDIVSEFTAAIAARQTLGELAAIVRPHPTFSEAVTEVTRL